MMAWCCCVDHVTACDAAQRSMMCVKVSPGYVKHEQCGRGKIEDGQGSDELEPSSLDLREIRG